MSNPFFDRSPAFKEGATATATRTPAGYPAMPGYQPGYQGQQQYRQYPQPAQGYGQQYGQQQYGQVSPEQVAGLEAQYGAPAAANVDLGRMTYDDVIVRTAVLLGVIVLVGGASWMLATSPATAALGMMVMMAGCVGALVMGLVNSFKKVPSPALIVTYAVFEGMMLGALSGVMEMVYPGIVMQAVVGTVATFGVMLAAYKVGGFRLTGKAQRILLIAMGGYLVFSLVNLVLMVTGLVSDPWGLRGVTVMGIPLGLLIGGLAVVMAAFSLVMDFDSIQRGVERGLPTRYAWAGAFGLTVTLVWLYVEILRILAILRGND
ncbi:MULTISPECIES: Bax inhibitor-1/YccA family protein [unclassified Actinomyces]|uniref:Bax inhibitor-1/YccA family protein n=1 Tax=unclassified Actinomyces TaxID=2609248 RepID=UPI002017C241|nr:MULTISPECIES: Bax inhibitor-1/YccA family protein [unclassified Actinomyces]MCL3776839.1 Bax inhibitor-1/YccA family protein [Actinomyces sp. AC-20-1]MCL3790734.1 Bax inhibitor-1/YccA family protein [Actinomyces sp. 187325]MCL3792786.1 Bax inhibitor-1/YccA family protein [Actinomyces sp. 186855]MCL3795540.1 Bax inhibitor-1/YccA family protein [Actinomyces sp. 217892]